MNTAMLKAVIFLVLLSFLPVLAISQTEKNQSRNLLLRKRQQHPNLTGRGL